MSGHVHGTSPPKAGPKQLVIKLGAGEKVSGVILCATIWGVATHWNDRAGKHGRSERCLKEKGECSGCNGQLPTRWKGYLYLWCERRRKAVFVEITPGVHEAIELKAPPDRPLRGLLITLRRGDGGNKTQIEVEIGNFLGSMESLPADRDPAPTLEMLWNWNR